MITARASFAGVTLHIAVDPPLGWEEGYLKQPHKHSGVDGSSPVDDSRLPTTWMVTGYVSSYAAMLVLRAMWTAGVTGDLVIFTPTGDTETYADAYAESARWTWLPGRSRDYYAYTVSFHCPNPRPTKGGGTNVF